MKAREIDRQKNYTIMADSYNRNKNNREKRRYDSSSFNEAVVRANKQEADNHKSMFDSHS
jgi:hypothetical protein